MTFARHPRPRALLAAVLLALAAIPARADDGGVGVVVTGEATLQPQLVAQLETWLRTHGHRVVAAPLPPDAINALIDCFVIEDPACARKVVDKRAKSRSIVFAQATVTSGDGDERTVTLTAHWFDKGKDPIVERRTCPRCTDVTVRSHADDLLASLADASLDRGHVKLTSTPPGATVTIGGKVVGKTPLEHSLPSGDHEIAVALDGRQTVTRKVSIEKGLVAELELELPVAPPGPSRALGYAVLVGGVALAAAGGVLIGLDEDVPADPSVPEYRDTAPAGVALAATGAVALGVGVYLLVRPPGRRAAPIVSPVAGGSVIGWAGRF